MSEAGDSSLPTLVMIDWDRSQTFDKLFDVPEGLVCSVFTLCSALCIKVCSLTHRLLSICSSSVNKRTGDQSLPALCYYPTTPTSEVILVKDTLHLETIDNNIRNLKLWQKQIKHWLVRNRLSVHPVLIQDGSRVELLRSHQVIHSSCYYCSYELFKYKSCHGDYGSMQIAWCM